MLEPALGVFLIMLGGFVLTLGAAWNRISTRLRARAPESSPAAPELYAEVQSLRTTVAELSGQLRALRAEVDAAAPAREDYTTAPLRRVA